MSTVLTSPAPQGRARGRRQLSNGAGAALLLGLGLTLILAARVSPGWHDRAIAPLTYYLTPVWETLRSPLVAGENLWSNTRELADIRAENARLNSELAKLSGLNEVNQELRAENIQLRQLLDFPHYQEKHFVTARVVGSGGVFVRSFLLDKGAADRVTDGMIAVDGNAMIGRVIQVEPNHSKLLAITDLNSRIPARTQGLRDPYSRVRFIVAGDNRPHPKISYFNPDDPLENGELVVTSGDGDQIPPGIPIGRLYQAPGSSEWRVIPLAHLSGPDIIQLRAY